MSDVPDLKDELERKSIEALEWLLHGVQTAQITPNELRVAMQTFFWVTSGLLSRDVSELSAQVGADAQFKQVERVILHHGARVLVATWAWGSSEFSLIEIQTGSTKVKTCDSAAEAKEKFEVLAKTLISKHGFKKV